VLSGLTGTRYFEFLHDICNYANSLAEHDRKLREVSDRLRKYLKLHPDKCEFLRKVTFLGHKVSSVEWSLMLQRWRLLRTSPNLGPQNN
jgi:hypothetical protein